MVLNTAIVAYSFVDVVAAGVVKLQRQIGWHLT